MRSLLSKLRNLRGGSFSGDVVLRAFGKLPIFREYIHVEDGEGPARAFAEWLGSGHDAWVAAHTEATRGELQPARLAITMPGHESTWIVAAVWPSHDAAPRHFPFTLFVTIPASGAPADPTGRLLNCQQVWERLDDIWSRLQPTDANACHAALRDARLTLAPIDAQSATQQIAADASKISWRAWLDALARQHGSVDAAHWMWWLKLLADGWSLDNAERRPVSARCPLTGEFPMMTQAVTWLQWLEKRVFSSSRRATGPAPLSIMLPASPSPAKPALTVLEGSPEPHDVQLLTTNADSFAGVEELARPAEALELDGFESFSQRVSRELADAKASLWSFSQFTA